MRIFVTGTSGWIGSAVVASERNMPEPFSGPGGRVLNGRATLALAERGARSMSTRFVPTVHGAAGDGGGRLAGGDRARRPHAGHRQAPQARGRLVRA